MSRCFGAEVKVLHDSNRLIDHENTAFENEGDGVAVRTICGGESVAFTATHVLLAVGRTPNNDDLGLDAVGVACDERGHTEVDGRLSIGVDGIRAVGDCDGRGAFTHTSYNDDDILAANLFDGESRKVSNRITAYAMLIGPPLERAGKSAREVSESGRVQALVAYMEISEVSRAKERDEPQGSMKVLVDVKTERVLGACFLGISGDEVVHSMIAVMNADAPYATIQHAVHIHLTVSELIPTLLEDLEPLE